MTSPSKPVVILFGVLRAGTDASERVVESGRAQLDEAVSAHGGRRVKLLADGVMAVFESPAGAVAAAGAMRDALAAASVELRVGLNLGEPLVEDGDYFGAPVVVARRLCDRAEPGQVLCSAIIAGLQSVRDAARIRSLGELELKGIELPVLAAEVLPR